MKLNKKIKHIIIFLISGLICNCPLVSVFANDQEFSETDNLSASILLQSDDIKTAFSLASKDNLTWRELAGLKYPYENIFHSDLDAPRWSLEGAQLEKFTAQTLDIIKIIENLSQTKNQELMFLSDKQIAVLKKIILQLPKRLDFVNKDDTVMVLRLILITAIDSVDDFQEIVGFKDQPRPIIDSVNELAGKLKSVHQFLKPLMPVESVFFNPEIVLSFQDMQRIKQCITWEVMFADAFSGSRKVIINLKHPIILANGQQITKVAIKGIVYKPGQKIRPPLRQIYRKFKSRRLNAKNEVEFFEKIMLKGALSLKGAKREYLIMKKLRDEGFSDCEYPIAYGKYKGFTYKGKQFGFLITSSEEPQEQRLWDEMVEKNKQYLTQSRKFKDAIMANNFFVGFETKLFDCGKQLRDFHDRGYYHCCPHLLNISFADAGSGPKLHDFESSRIIKNLPVDRKVAYKLMDLYSAYMHFLGFVFEDPENSMDKHTLEGFFQLSLKLKRHENPFHFFLEGYFYKNISTDISYFPEEIINSSADNYQIPIERIQSEIVNTLYMIERGDVLPMNHFSQIKPNDYDQSLFFNESSI
ncbi:MAG: hypothetical protein KJ915_06725 [Candidatus Omnitrophica bacterium]|nr:hypothetical protein [Candidatus Omnitrophota bacterium]